MTTTNTTLVLGASGKSGRRVAARLRLRGVPVRAASRSSETPFDWTDTSTWDAALHGVAAVYVVAPSTVGPVHDFVARAEAAGVQRLVLLSGRGADAWGDSEFGTEMRDAEKAVRNSTLDWTILRPNNFAQNFDEELWHAPLLTGDFALPAGEVPEPLIDLEDVADVAATVLTEPGRHAGQIYELSGPQALTFAESVQKIATATGRPITYRQISPAEYTAMLAEEGLDQETAHHISEMFVLMERGLIATTTDTVQTLLGRPARTFEDYVLRTAATGVWNP